MVVQKRVVKYYHLFLLHEQKSRKFKMTKKHSSKISIMHFFLTSSSQLHNLTPGLLFQDLGDPLEGSTVTGFLFQTDHKDLSGTTSWSAHDLTVALLLVSVPKVVVSLNIQKSSEFFFGAGGWNIDFVTEDGERDVLETFGFEERVQFVFGFHHTCTIGGIDEVDDTVNIRVIITPDSASGFVASEIESFESAVTVVEFLTMRVESWDMCCDTVVPKHVKKRCLTSVI